MSWFSRADQSDEDREEIEEPDGSRYFQACPLVNKQMWAWSSLEGQFSAGAVCMLC